MNAKEISIELSHSLSEWGVSKERAHDEFRQGVIMVGIQYFSMDPSVVNFQHLHYDDEFPTDINAAFEYFLRREDVVTPLFCYEDKINMEAREPYFRLFNTDTREIEYRLKPKFLGIPAQELDPFNRFQFEQMSKEEHFFSKWLVDSGKNAEIGGKLMESYLACYQHEHQQECFHCNSKKSLRWNDYSTLSWQDFVCLVCNAIYKVKTKADMKAVDLAFHFNKIGCGSSYEEFCKIRNSQPRPKMFLVVLPRKSIIRDVGKVYPVHIAEITKGMPTLYHGAFNKGLSTLRFKTVVSVDPSTKETWFDLPRRRNIVDVGAVAKKVFIEKFSKNMYIELEALYFEDSESEDESDNANSTEIRDVIKDIKTSSGNIKHP
eukprot:scaffold2837_cov249-Chaetoceros_neogracile.AAC.9